MAAIQEEEDAAYLSPAPVLNQQPSQYSNLSVASMDRFSVFSSASSGITLPIPDEVDPQLLKKPISQSEESSDSDLVGIPRFEAEVDVDSDDSSEESESESESDEDDDEEEEEYASSISIGSTSTSSSEESEDVQD